MSQRLQLRPLTQSIREIIALGGIVLASTNAWAESLINPNEIRPGTKFIPNKVCAKDIDQDGGLDLFTITPSAAYMAENIGTPASPKFTSPLHVASFPSDVAGNSYNFKLFQLGILGYCHSYENSEEKGALVDIDADGDLDLFGYSNDKLFDFAYFKNEGTTDYPRYVKKKPQDEFGIPNEITSYMFKDIDADGDQDLWSIFNYEPVFLRIQELRRTQPLFNGTQVQ